MTMFVYKKASFNALLVVAALATAGDVFAKAKPGKLEKQEWYRITTDNFTIISDHGKRGTLELAMCQIGSKRLQLMNAMLSTPWLIINYV